ncbi:hypothetical protein [Streptomyces lavendofoliae]|uniref:hypothetical protein n=1 Tax=Streptomyces lavendofoliae TaxID=67314 RepID=UPI00300EB5F1
MPAKAVEDNDTGARRRTGRAPWPTARHARAPWKLAERGGVVILLAGRGTP